MGDAVHRRRAQGGSDLSRRPRVALLLAVALAAGTAAPARAQRAARASEAPPPLPGQQRPEFAYPGWAGELAVFSGNALLGALTAGVGRALHGGSFSEGFSRGFLGGTVVYAGKRIGIERFDGAGLLGREIAAVGASAVANAGADRPLLERLSLPVGVGWLRIDRAGPGTHLSGRLDLVPLTALVWGIAESRLDFDWSASLSAGAPVFRSPGLLFRRSWTDEDTSTGEAIAGSVFLADVPNYGHPYLGRVFRHERVHVMQTDFFTLAWGDALESALRDHFRPAGAVPDAVGLGLGEVILSTLSAAWSGHDRRPWELEAIFLEGR